MNIYAISGSLRARSYNSALLENINALDIAGLNLTRCDFLADIPLFNPDVCENIIPESISRLRACIEQADAMIISTPEYAHGIPGALKNALDWLVAFDEIILKPIAVMSVSTSGLGGYRAQFALIQVLHAMNTNVIIEACLSIPFAKNKFDDQNRLLDPDTAKVLENAISHIMAYPAVNHRLSKSAVAPAIHPSHGP